MFYKIDVLHIWHIVEANSIKEAMEIATEHFKTEEIREITLMPHQSLVKAVKV